MNNVVHGTVIEESPSSSATIGSKANTMMVSLSATWLSVKFGSPSVRLDQTNTIAVQGAAARIMRPAMWLSICPAGSNGGNSQPINSQPSKAMLKGLTSQLIPTVTA